MRPFLVNLPLGYAFAPMNKLEHMARAGVEPEWGLDNILLDKSAFGYLAGMAERMRSLDLSCSVHLPFSGIRPADPHRRGPTDSALALAGRAAALFSPDLLIAHPYLDTSLPARELDREIRTAADAFRAFMDQWPGHPPLYLENTHETFPEPLAELVLALDDPKTGVCLDVGHWHSFGGGSLRKDLDRWVAVLAPCMRHLHLHDNHGSMDEHLGLGRGTIPWDAFFAQLADLDLAPTATLEPHSLGDFQASVDYIRAHPGFFTRLGVPPRV